MRTWPGPAAGSATSSSFMTSGAPNSRTTIALIRQIVVRLLPWLLGLLDQAVRFQLRLLELLFGHVDMLAHVDDAIVGGNREQVWRRLGAHDAGEAVDGFTRAGVPSRNEHRHLQLFREPALGD